MEVYVWGKLGMKRKGEGGGSRNEGKMGRAVEMGMESELTK